MSDDFNDTTDLTPEQLRSVEIAWNEEQEAREFLAVNIDGSPTDDYRPIHLQRRYGVQEAWTEVDNGTVSEALGDAIELCNDAYQRDGTSDEYMEWIELIYVLIGTLKSDQN